MKKTVTIVGCSLICTVLVLIAAWYGFSLHKLSKIPTNELAYIIATGSLEPDEFSRGYAYPLPPKAMQWNFFRREITQDDINLAINEKLMLKIFGPCALRQPDGQIPEMAPMVLDHYIKHGYNINTLHSGGSLLHIAAVTGCKPVVHLLLSRGADPNIKINNPAWEHHGKTPLEFTRAAMDSAKTAVNTNKAKSILMGEDWYPELPSVIEQLEAKIKTKESE